MLLIKPSFWHLSPQENVTPWTICLYSASQSRAFLPRPGHSTEARPLLQAKTARWWLRLSALEKLAQGALVPKLVSPTVHPREVNAIHRPYEPMPTRRRKSPTISHAAQALLPPPLPLHPKRDTPFPQEAFCSFVRPVTLTKFNLKALGDVRDRSLSGSLCASPTFQPPAPTPGAQARQRPGGPPEPCGGGGASRHSPRLVKKSREKVGWVRQGPLSWEVETQGGGNRQVSRIL